MKNNKRKVLPLLLAGVLLLSAGAYGTRAYFTDSAEQKVDIVLTMGNLEIESATADVWKYTPEIVAPLDQYDINDQLSITIGTITEKMVYEPSKAIYPLASAITVSNVRPGDAFERIFTFSNTGSLTQKISINDTELKALGLAPYTVTIEGISGTASVSNGFILNPETSVSYTMKISVSGSGIGNTYNTVTLGDYMISYLEKSLTVTATQPNAPVPAN